MFINEKLVLPGGIVLFGSGLFCGLGFYGYGLARMVGKKGKGYFVQQFECTLALIYI